MDTTQYHELVSECLGFCLAGSVALLVALGFYILTWIRLNHLTAEVKRLKRSLKLRGELRDEPDKTI